MARAPHLLLAVSGHGYGHLAQCAPVVNALRVRLQDLRLTVMGELDRGLIERWLAGEFAVIRTVLEPQLRMHSAWELDVTAFCRASGEFHRNWSAELQRECDRLHAIDPDLVLADIPYRLLVAARQSGIPAVALCSLNWASVHAAYCGAPGSCRELREQMWSGYRAADVFLAPAPSLPMPQLENLRAIGPIARRGRSRPAFLREALGLPPATARVVLVALGGIPTELPLEHWPCRDDVAWLFPSGVPARRADRFDFGRLSIPFIDVLASADAVLTKPGYGTYAEAVCNAVPILTLSRPDWPETPCLNDWARAHGCLQEITPAQFRCGDFLPALDRLWRQPRKTPPQPEGVSQAAGILEKFLTGGLRQALPAG
jgi:hypothetical protein